MEDVWVVVQACGAAGHGGILELGENSLGHGMVLHSRQPKLLSLSPEPANSAAIRLNLHLVASDRYDISS